MKAKTGLRPTAYVGVEDSALLRVRNSATATDSDTHAVSVST